MKSFDYTISDPAGIHARPAGVLVKEIKNWGGSVTVTKDGKSVDARKLMALLGRGARAGDVVTVRVEGEGEEEIAAKLEEFCRTYF